NSLLVQDTVSKVRQIKELITQLDIPVRQVQIAARIVEATDDFSRVLGARLGFTQVTRVDTGSGLADVYQSGTLENTNLIRTEGLTEIGRPPGSGDIGGDVVENGALSVNLPASGIQGEPAGSYAFTIAKIGSGVISLLDLELSALQAEGKGKLLANPKVLTNDKQEAHIEQGQERIFRNLGGGGGINTGNNFLTKKAVLSLTVTPQITPDNQIILDVAITNDTFADAVLGLLNLKRVRTQTLLENGETVVIGGIYQQRTAENVSKVPLLGDIPVLGYLFKKKQIIDQRSELLIFLTPRIIDSALSVR
ncbi:MAG: type IV pilus secretin PilQ, partial [Pseudomonadota bacterium]|nr:type IV pilus secretin PilQ [Pseudomonadota bacterium]